MLLIIMCILACRSDSDSASTFKLHPAHIPRPGWRPMGRSHNRVGRCDQLVPGIYLMLSYLQIYLYLRTRW